MQKINSTSARTHVRKANGQVKNIENLRKSAIEFLFVPIRYCCYCCRVYIPRDKYPHIAKSRYIARIRPGERPSLSHFVRRIPKTARTHIAVHTDIYLRENHQKKKPDHTQQPKTMNSSSIFKRRNSQESTSSPLHRVPVHIHLLGQ